MRMMLADCRAKVTVDVIRGKWKPIIIKALKDCSLGYAELRRIVPEPSKKVLSDHLRELEADRIIARTALAGRSIRTEYSLTEYGRTLIPVLAVMRAWGQTHRELVLGLPRSAEDDTAPCAIASFAGAGAHAGVIRVPNVRFSSEPGRVTKKCLRETV